MWFSERELAIRYLDRNINSKKKQLQRVLPNQKHFSSLFYSLEFYENNYSINKHLKQFEKKTLSG